jgi:hypothetical protein
MTNKLRTIGRFFDRIFLIITFNASVTLTFCFLAATAPWGMLPTATLAAIVWVSIGPMFLIPRIFPLAQRWTLLEASAHYLLYSAVLGLLVVALTKNLLLSMAMANTAAIACLLIDPLFSRLSVPRK